MLWKIYCFVLECFGEIVCCLWNFVIVFVKFWFYWLLEGSFMFSDVVINLVDEDILEMMNLEYYEEDMFRFKDGFEVMLKFIYFD